VAILREAHWKRWRCLDVTKVCGPEHRYKILTLRSLNRALWYTACNKNQQNSHFLHQRFNLINSVLDMFRTSKCTSSGRLVHAVLCYFFHAEIIIKGYVNSLKYKLLSS
jgi:hypothetical protein